MALSALVSLRSGTAGYARLVYAGLLFGLVLPGVNLAAAALAWRGRGADDPVLESHTRNQLSIFWKSVVYVVTGLVLTYFLVGVLVLIAAIGWYILRILRGLRDLSAGRPAANPDSWLF